MAGDKINRSIRPGARLIDITGTSDPKGCRLGHAFIAFQVSAHIITVSSVPFCPAVPGREGADLVEAVGVPCFGDQLHVS